MHYYHQVTPPFKIVLTYTLTQCSHVPFSPMKLQAYTSCSCFCCLFGLFHCVQISSMHCAKTQALQVIDSLPVLLIALAFFTLLIFVCRQILLPQLPRENWKLVPKLTRILLPELIRKNIADESHQNIAVKSCPERIATESHQNIAVKAF